MVTNLDSDTILVPADELRDILAELKAARILATFSSLMSTGKKPKQSKAADKWLRIVDSKKERLE